jgi:hypothetical protein
MKTCKWGAGRGRGVDNSNFKSRVLFLCNTAGVVNDSLLSVVNGTPVKNASAKAHVWRGIDRNRLRGFYVASVQT